MSRSVGKWIAAGSGALVLLAACERFGPPMGMGPPDLILEEAGDMGRFLAPGEVPAYTWKTSARVYYYLRQEIKVRVTERGSTRTVLAPEEHDTVAQLLERRRQGHPIN